MQDKHKSAKEAALKKLMDMLDSQGADDLKGLKAKPVASMSVTEVKPPMDDEPLEDHDDEESETDLGELSPREKALIAAHRSGK